MRPLLERDPGCHKIAVRLRETGPDRNNLRASLLGRFGVVGFTPGLPDGGRTLPFSGLSERVRKARHLEPLPDTGDGHERF